jgi:serine/threonine-protein kinase RsbW
MTRTRGFRARPESVPAVRGFVRDALRDQPRDVVDAVELMACELATNCVRHAHTDFELTVHAQDEIRVEVRDTNHGRPQVQFPPPEQPSGRGLRIVEAMSETWGVIPSSSGKTVWFAVSAQQDAAGKTRRASADKRGGRADGPQAPGRDGARPSKPRTGPRGASRLRAARISSRGSRHDARVHAPHRRYPLKMSSGSLPLTAPDHPFAYLVEPPSASSS